MSQFEIYSLAAAGLFALGLYGLATRRDLVRKIVALNVMGSAVFLLLISMAFRDPEGGVDPVPQAMVLTGIVVAVSTTALGLGIARRIEQETGSRRLPEDDDAL